MLTLGCAAQNIYIKKKHTVLYGRKKIKICYFYLSVSWGYSSSNEEVHDRATWVFAISLDFSISFNKNFELYSLTLLLTICFGEYTSNGLKILCMNCKKTFADTLQGTCGWKICQYCQKHTEERLAYTESQTFKKLTVASMTVQHREIWKTLYSNKSPQTGHTQEVLSKILMQQMPLSSWDQTGFLYLTLIVGHWSQNI